MSVAPHSGIIDFGTFESPTGGLDGKQGEVPAPLIAEAGYFLSTNGWVPGGGGGGAVTQIIAGTNVTISPAGGTGAVTINATGGSGGVTSVTGAAPVVSSGGTTPAISMAKATTLVDGYLSAVDWNTFNNKQPAGSYLTAVTVDVPLTGAGTSASHLSIPAATTSVSGYLTNTDWNTFNNKQPAGSYLTAVTADAPLSGSGTSGSHLVIAQATTSTSGYLTSTDWNTFNNKGSGTVTSVTGTAPVSSTGGATPAISIAKSTTAVDGYLAATDFTTFNNKQAALVSGTNIKTVGGTTLLGAGDVPVVTQIIAGTNVTISPTGGTGAVTINATGGGGGTSPAGANTQIQFNNSGAFGASSNLTWDGTTAKATNLEATGGVLADSAFTGTYVDGIVMDYDTVGAAGRISVGGADSIKFYNGGVAGSLLGSVNNAGDWSITRFLDIGNGTLIGGATNPIIAAAGSANQYVQAYIHNDLAGSSASADLAAYPDNGTDASGWIDVGITSSTYSDVNYLLTGANEGYIFMSAPSGANKTGNLVYATDSTGSSNAHQWYVGGFNVAKSAWKMQLGASGFDLKTALLLSSSAGTSGQVFTSAGPGATPTWTTPTTGTVTSVAALTLGTTGTDLSSTVATGTTTPVITLNVPTASATNRGALSSTDWSTFNGKQDALVSGTNIKTINGSSVLGSGNLTVSAAAGGSDTQIQYNSAGALTGSANLTFNGTTVTAASAIISASAGSIAPLKFTSGTNLATAQAGAFEYDGTVPYFSIANSTRGIIRNEQYVVLNTTYTLTSQTAAQKLFNATTNGAITLPIGTHYFECFYSLSVMSATTGSFGFAMVAGTAVIGSQGWMSIAEKGTATLITATAGQLTYSTAANTALTTTSANTVGYALIRGTIKITTAGTVIPSVSLGVASAAVVGINSYFKTYPISGTAAANIAVGNWT